MQYGKENNNPVLYNDGYQIQQPAQNYNQQPNMNFNAQQYPSTNIDYHPPQNNIPYGMPIQQPGYMQQPNVAYYDQNSSPNIVSMGAAHISMMSNIPLSQKKLSSEFKCPTCGFMGKTETNKEIGNAVWIWVLILCFVFPLLSCLPCLMDDCKDVEHRCPSCKTHLDTYHRNAC